MNHCNNFLHFKNIEYVFYIPKCILIDILNDKINYKDSDFKIKYSNLDVNLKKLKIIETYNNNIFYKMQIYVNDKLYKSLSDLESDSNKNKCEDSNKNKCEDSKDNIDLQFNAIIDTNTYLLTLNGNKINTLNFKNI